MQSSADAVGAILHATIDTRRKEWVCSFGMCIDCDGTLVAAKYFDDQLNETECVTRCMEKGGKGCMYDDLDKRCFM